MKIGFNEATALECKGQSLIADLEACEKYGFDYIEISIDETDEKLARLDMPKAERMSPGAVSHTP